MRKGVALCLCLLFLSSLLVSCQGKTENTSSQTSKTANVQSQDVSGNSAEKATAVTKDIEKMINDLQLEKDSATVDNEDYTNDVQSTAGEFEKILKSEDDKIS